MDPGNIRDISQVSYCFPSNFLCVSIRFYLLSSFPPFLLLLFFIYPSSEHREKHSVGIDIVLERHIGVDKRLMALHGSDSQTYRDRSAAFPLLLLAMDRMMESTATKIEAAKSSSSSGVLKGIRPLVQFIHAQRIFSAIDGPPPLSEMQRRHARTAATKAASFNSVNRKFHQFLLAYLENEETAFVKATKDLEWTTERQQLMRGTVCCFFIAFIQLFFTAFLTHAGHAAQNLKEAARDADYSSDDEDDDGGDDDDAEEKI